MPEPDATDVDDQEPLDEDTPDDDDGQDPQDTPGEPEQPSTDWETRYKESEKLRTRQAHELGLWRRGEAPDAGRRSAQGAPAPDEGDGAADGGSDDGYVAGLEQQSWELAEARYGADAVNAYGAAYEILGRAQTPADYIAAFEAYHEIRAGGGSPADAAAAAGATGGGRKTRAQAVQPRVDPNGTDAGPDLTDDKKVAEARKKGDLMGFIRSSLESRGL